MPETRDHFEASKSPNSPDFVLSTLNFEYLIFFLFQEQDPPNSLFSFAIDISDNEGEEASSSQAVGITSVEIKAKLEDLLALLHQDIAQLVDDSDPAKAIFKTLRGQIPVDAEEILFQAPHLESRQL